MNKNTETTSIINFPDLILVNGSFDCPGSLGQLFQTKKSQTASPVTSMTRKDKYSICLIDVQIKIDTKGYQTESSLSKRQLQSPQQPKLEKFLYSRLFALDHLMSFQTGTKTVRKKSLQTAALPKKE